MKMFMNPRVDSSQKKVSSKCQEPNVTMHKNHWGWWIMMDGLIMMDYLWWLMDYDGLWWIHMNKVATLFQDQQPFTHSESHCLISEKLRQGRCGNINGSKRRQYVDFQGTAWDLVRSAQQRKRRVFAIKDDYVYKQDNMWIYIYQISDINHIDEVSKQWNAQKMWCGSHAQISSHIDMLFFESINCNGWCLIICYITT